MNNIMIEFSFLILHHLSIATARFVFGLTKLKTNLLAFVFHKAALFA